MLKTSIKAPFPPVLCLNDTSSAYNLRKQRTLKSKCFAIWNRCIDSSFQLGGAERQSILSSEIFSRSCWKCFCTWGVFIGMRSARKSRNEAFFPLHPSLLQFLLSLPRLCVAALQWPHSMIILLSLSFLLSVHHGVELNSRLSVIIVAM